jgi:hypothetical protein
MDDPAFDTALDLVIGNLVADRIGEADRRRLDKALDGANRRADGTKASSNQAFGRITRGDGAVRIRTLEAENAALRRQLRGNPEPAVGWCEYDPLSVTGGAACT